MTTEVVAMIVFLDHCEVRNEDKRKEARRGVAARRAAKGRRDTKPARLHGSRQQARARQFFHGAARSGQASYKR